jgi:hypothetical protein
MKRIHEMTEEELIVLDESDTNKLIDYECALEGVPMLPPHPGPEPKMEKITADHTVYEICSLYFASITDASNVLDAINNANGLYKSEGWSDDQHLERLCPGDYSYPKISTNNMISSEAWAAKRSAIEAHKTLKSVYDRSKKVYDTAYKERESIVQNVYDKIRTAKDNAYERDRYREEFKRYLELADKDTTIAMRFLIKAKPDLKTDFPELIKELCPDYEGSEF